MRTMHKWEISNMRCHPEMDGLTNVVFMVDWHRQATDGTHHVEVYGSQILTLDPAEPFTPYENLTIKKVCGWLESLMGSERVAELDAELDRQIKDKTNPPFVSPALPWA